VVFGLPQGLNLVYLGVYQKVHVRSKNADTLTHDTFCSEGNSLQFTEVLFCCRSSGASFCKNSGALDICPNYPENHKT
jgi:hypothetical protein